jgi:hypothetical protein
MTMMLHGSSRPISNSVDRARWASGVARAQNDVAAELYAQFLLQRDCTSMVVRTPKPCLGGCHTLDGRLMGTSRRVRIP